MMKAQDIRSTIRSYLHLIEEGTISVDQNEKSLFLMIDRLALASHYRMNVTDQTGWPVPPERDSDRLHEVVVKRFPNFGYYNVPENIIRDVASTDCLVGDAIDDIVDIAVDLFDVEWYWEHLSEPSALCCFEDRYRAHWGEHLRHLQLYLYVYMKQKELTV